MCNEPDTLESPILPITLDPSIVLADGVLEVAMQYLLATHESPKAHTDIRKARTALQRGYTITDDGAAEIIGSNGTDVYLVRGSVCYRKGQVETNPKTKKHTAALCRGWKAAQKTTGACYHCWATEILLTAQAFQTGLL